MRYVFGKTVVVALGGSIVYPKGIDIGYLKRFKRLIEKFLKNGICPRAKRGSGGSTRNDQRCGAAVKFVIVVGGGQLARVFQNAAHEVAPVPNEDKDWIGIHSTRLNAHLLRTIFRKVADPIIIDSRHKIKNLKYPVTIASGWRPGWSTDFVAAAIANDFGIPEFVVAGKPAYVYDKDPYLHKDARPFEKISWKKYCKLIPAKWIPGSHAPVDPVAARLGLSEDIKAVIVNGKNLNNFGKLLSGKEFRGTIIG